MVIIDRKKQNGAEHEITDISALRKSLEKKRADALLFWKTFFLTGAVILSSIAGMVIVGVAWYVSNSRTQTDSIRISFTGDNDFALATVGKKEQGVYDSAHGLSTQLAKEKIGKEEYYIASGNSSFRLDSDKNFNNYFADADLRPGNRGSFDLYVICRSTENRNLELMPVFSAWESDDPTVTDQDFVNAKAFLKGHILLFANMDDKGMYRGSIDYTKKIAVTLKGESGSASQSEDGQSSRSFSWGERVYSDAKTAVYRLPIYWVWPEQFGNFIYTGNAYNKNLFASKGTENNKTDYEIFIDRMAANSGSCFFVFPEVVPKDIKSDIVSITAQNTPFKDATERYNNYSGWYNAADDEIGRCISYIQLGFELAQESTP